MQNAAIKLPPGTLLQYSGVEAFELLEYDGSLALSEVPRYGDFGLGCFNALDGELIVFDGDYYHATADGTLKRGARESLISCAYFTTFVSAFSSQLGLNDNFESLDEKIREIFKHPGEPFCALRIDGHFEKIYIRSVPAQRKPYPPISEVVKEQSLFEFQDVQATMVGFYFPKYLNGLTYPGFHLHFVTEDRKRGGHVLDFQVGEASLQVCPIETYTYILPDYVRNN